MSDNYDYVYEVWAELAIQAAQSTTPTQKIIALFLEFETGVYNSALNDVLLNLERSEQETTNANIVKKMHLDPRLRVGEPRHEKIEVTPFAEA